MSLPTQQKCTIPVLYSVYSMAFNRTYTYKGSGQTLSSYHTSCTVHILTERLSQRTHKIPVNTNCCHLTEQPFLQCEELIRVW